MVIVDLGGARGRGRGGAAVGFSRGAVDRRTAAIRRVGVKGPSEPLVVRPGWFGTLGAAGGTRHGIEAEAEVEAEAWRYFFSFDLKVIRVLRAETL